MNILIDPKELRKITNKVISEANAERIKKENERIELISGIKNEALIDLKKYLAQVPEEAKKAALLGQSSTTLYDISQYVNFGRQDVNYSEAVKIIQKIVEDMIIPSHGNRIDRDKLRECIFLVDFMYQLNEAQLNPSLLYWWSGDGQDSGYKVQIKW